MLSDLEKARQVHVREQKAAEWLGDDSSNNVHAKQIDQVILKIRTKSQEDDKSSSSSANNDFIYYCGGFRMLESLCVDGECFWL